MLGLQYYRQPLHGKDNHICIYACSLASAFVSQGCPNGRSQQSGDFLIFFARMFWVTIGAVCVQLVSAGGHRPITPAVVDRSRVLLVDGSRTLDPQLAGIINPQSHLRPRPVLYSCSMSYPRHTAVLKHFRANSPTRASCRHSA